jgi:hypothetical protein
MERLGCRERWMGTREKVGVCGERGKFKVQSSKLKEERRSKEGRER